MPQKNAALTSLPSLDSHPPEPRFDCHHPKMVGLDAVDNHHGRGTVRFAAAGLEVDQRAWAM